MPKRLLSLAFILIFIACKNENKEPNPAVESQKTSTDTVSTESTQTDSSKVVVANPNLEADKKLLADFFVKNDKKPQFFTINNTKDTTIICVQKTKITIRANSFVTSNSKNAVTGKVKISVKEYYSISDILLGRLSTTSNGKLLETGGMLEINAFSNNEKCQLKSGKAIEIAFPTKKEKEGMQLFSGSWKNNQINWEVAENSVNLNQTFGNVDEAPIFPGGINKFYKLLSSRIHLEGDEEVSGKVYASFVIDREGNVTNIKIVKGLTKKINEAVIKAFNNIPKFIPGKVNGIAVNTTYSLPITIQSSNDELDDRPSSTYIDKKQRKNYTEETIKEEEISTIGYYFFSSFKLGIINCDRFYNLNQNAAINFAVNFENGGETFVSIVFHQMKSIISINTNSKNAVFKTIPKGKKITIVAIKYIDNKPFIGIKETTTSAIAENNLAFQPITLQGIKSEMEKLNRFD
ncbi:energy transducer TonB [Flavobacterium artemisiae]|uniref:Energy transducer TonB n=1 Tax=Flavobacterium artemisiae TaxID=2126556 RepID=A0ABW4HLX0_9FLAO